MSVSTKNQQYTHKQYEWRQLRDCSAGMSNIKRSASLYLPIPTAMTEVSNDPVGTSQNPDSDITDNAPWSHSIKAYSAYLQRARFPNITADCLRGLVGVALKTDPVVELPASMEYLLENATGDGSGLFKLFEKIVAENLLTGRYEILVDPVMDSDGVSKLLFVTYNTESFINWKDVVINGSVELKLAVFEEAVAEDDDDEFSEETKEAYVVMRLSVDPEDESKIVYTTQKYVDDEPVDSVPTVPKYMGKAFESIPLVIINSMSVGSKINAAPMIGISDIAISIYQKDADMSNAEFVTCNPMLITSGVDNDSVPTAIGSGVCWNLENAEAQAYYVEPKSNCLQHVSKRIQDLFEEAVQYGISLLGPEKSSAEAAETIRLRQASSGATLKTVVSNSGEGVEQGLKIMAEAMGEDPDKIVFEPNLEFSESSLSPQEQAALLQSWLNGGISYETYFESMQDAGIIPGERTIEDERALIETAAPILDVKDVKTGKKPGVKSGDSDDEENEENETGDDE